MIFMHMFHLVALLVLLCTREISTEILAPEDPEGFIKRDGLDTKPAMVSENDVDGLLKYAGVFGGGGNDYSQVIPPFDPSLQAHIRVKRLTD